MIRGILFALFTGGALAGCVTMGSPFDVARVPEIELGKTTRTDLEQLFGPPYRTGLDDGDDTATWLHYRLALLGDRRTRDLYVRFHADGRVKSYSFNSNLEEDRELLRKARR